MWLCRQARFHLPASLLLSAASEVLGADLPGEVMFESEGTPGLAWTDILSAHPQQDQVGHQRYGHRALDPGSIPGHLVLPHAYHPLPFLKEQLHWPASEVYCHRSMRCRLRQIGHQHFGLFGAVVAPPFAEHHGDISDLTQRGWFGKGPKDAIAGTAAHQGQPDFAIVSTGQMSDQVVQTVAISKLPGPREGDNEPPVAGLNRPQILPRGIGRIRHHDDFGTPPR